MKEVSFSVQIQAWLNGNQPKTIASLEKVFAEKSFAAAILILMFIPALPLPTGGISHIFELMTMLLCLEMVAGIKAIWLPKKWREKPIKPVMQKKAIPFVIRRIRWFEKFSRPRLKTVVNNTAFVKITGAIVLFMTMAAFLAVPFSGLDTLPSLGVVIIALSILLDDIVIFLIGCVVGSVGIGLVIGSGLAAENVIRHFIY